MLTRNQDCSEIQSTRENLLQFAESEAEKAAASGRNHAAAFLVKNGEIIASGRDRTIELNDPVAVAVADCFRNAGRRNDQSELELYCAPAPDMLAAGIMIQFGVGVLIVREKVSESAVLEFLESEKLPIISLSPERASS